MRVVRPKPENAEAAGMTGAVLALADEPGAGSVGVFLDALERVWCFDEDELETTSHVGRRQDHYDDRKVLRVRVDREGRGTLVDDDE